MINVDLSTIKDNIYKHKKDQTAYLVKSFCSNPPSWDSLMHCLSKESTADGSKIKPLIPKNNGEEIFGTVVHKGLYLNINFVPDQLKDYFPEIEELLVQVNSATEFDFQISGLKMVFYPYDVVPHKDTWDGFALQNQGVSYWTITSDDGSYKEDFTLEPGDFLFFPVECTHAIKSIEPRSTFIFNSNKMQQ